MEGKGKEREGMEMISRKGREAEEGDGKARKEMKRRVKKERKGIGKVRRRKEKGRKRERKGYQEREEN